MRGECQKYNPTQSRNMSNRQWKLNLTKFDFFLPQNNLGSRYSPCVYSTCKAVEFCTFAPFIIFFKSRYQYIESINCAAMIGISSNMYYQSTPPMKLRQKKFSNTQTAEILFDWQITMVTQIMWPLTRSADYWPDFTKIKTMREIMGEYRFRRFFWLRTSRNMGQELTFTHTNMNNTCRVERLSLDTSDRRSFVLYCVVVCSN